jgi:nicotinamidase-related amidase
MLRVKRKMAFEPVLIDVATQQDFLVTNGPMSVLNRADIIPNIRSIFNWARDQRLKVISCIQAHRPGDDFGGHPRHCIDGTPGQKKLPYTLLPRRIVVEADNSYTVPYDLMQHYHQAIFHKRTEDLLGNPKADRVINELQPDRYIIFGVGLESWIKLLALGLMIRHKPAAVVSDACGFWDANVADLVVRQLEAKGIQLLKTADVVVMEKVRPRRQILAPAPKFQGVAQTP